MRRILTLLQHTGDFVLATQRTKVARAHANIRKVLTTALPLPPLQRSESQHSYVHVPPAFLHTCNFESGSSQRALVEQDLANLLDVLLLGSLNSVESSLQ